MPKKQSKPNVEGRAGTKAKKSSKGEAISVSPDFSNTHVGCSLSYEQVVSAVKDLEDEFNNRLLSLLKSSKEDVVIGLADWSHGRMRASHITNPVCVNVVKASDAAGRQTPTYGNGVIKLGRQQIVV